MNTLDVQLLLQQGPYARDPETTNELVQIFTKNSLLSNPGICRMKIFVHVVHMFEDGYNQNMSSWTWFYEKSAQEQSGFLGPYKIAETCPGILDSIYTYTWFRKNKNGVSFWVVGKQLKTIQRSSNVTCSEGLAVICSRFCRKHPILSTGFRSCFKINMVLANNKLQTIDAKQCRAFNVAWSANHDRRFFIHVRFNPIVEMSFQAWKLNFLDLFTTTNKLHSNRNVQWHFRIGSALVP